MSIALTVLYDHPDDPAAFDLHYTDVHAPLTATLPHLASFGWVRPGPGPDGSPPRYHAVATLVFPNAELMQEALTSPEGKAGNADLANFAQAGVTILVGELQQVV